MTPDDVRGSALPSLRRADPDRGALLRGVRLCSVATLPRTDPRRQVRDPRQGRRGRHGRGVPRPAPPPRRDPHHQGHQARRRRRRRVGPTLPGRGATGDARAPPERGGALRLLAPARRLLLHGLGVHRRRHSPGVASRARPARSRASDRRRPPGPRRARRDPRPGNRPPGPLPRQHHGEAGRGTPARQDHRPRDRQARRRGVAPDDGHRTLSRQAQVLLARASRGAARRPDARRTDRHLLARRRSVRDALGAGAVRVVHSRGLHRQAPPHAAAAARRLRAASGSR